MKFNTSSQVPKELINQIRKLFIQQHCLAYSQAVELSDKRVLIVACLNMLPKKLQTQWLTRLDNKQHVLSHLVQHSAPITTSTSLAGRLNDIEYVQKHLTSELTDVGRAAKLLNSKIDAISSLFG